MVAKEWKALPKEVRRQIVIEGVQGVLPMDPVHRRLAVGWAESAARRHATLLAVHLLIVIVWLAFFLEPYWLTLLFFAVEAAMISVAIIGLRAARGIRRAAASGPAPS